MDPQLLEDQQAAAQVGHSLNMIAELPASTDDDTLSLLLRTAALDAFFMHMRGLIEFFVMQRNKKNFHAVDLSARRRHARRSRRIR